ncbi:MAG: hypothetical protein HY682_01425, partial [Chloroflexi bacterium]|nr:hypothetical protein [Chloroflexota bacterium]
VRTPHTSTTTAQLTDASAVGKLPAALVSADFSVTNSTQEVSTRWPEKFITSAATSSFPAIYHEVFTTASSTESGTVRRVTLLDKTGKAQDGKVFLEGHTAVDISALKTNNLLQDDPSGSTLESSALNGAYEAPNFLWLFKKSSTGDGVSAEDDSRDVVVYKLLKVDEVEVSGASTQVDLTYQRIF